MKRREFIFGLGGAALCSNAARGQQNSPFPQQSTTKKRIAQVAPATKVEALKDDAPTRVYLDELRRHGYVEGENLTVERYSGEGRLERLKLFKQSHLIRRLLRHTPWRHEPTYKHILRVGLLTSRENVPRFSISSNGAFAQTGLDPLMLGTAGQCFAWFAHDLAKGIAYIDEALSVNPNHAHAYMQSGFVRTRAGDTEVAIKHLNHAMRLSPRDSRGYAIFHALAFAHQVSGNSASE